MNRRQPIRMDQSHTKIVERLDENSSLTISKTIDGSDHRSSKERSAVDKVLAGSCNGENKIKTITDPAITDKDPPKKAVHWNPVIGRAYHLSRKDMPQAERESYWYSKKDDKKSFQMAKVTVKMIMRGQPFDDVDNCSRGLEGKTLIESKKRARNKKKVNSAVLAEQELQRLEGIKIPEDIASASMEHTKEVSIAASDTAIEDERVIQEYMDDVRLYRDDFQQCIPSQSTESPRSSE